MNKNAGETGLRGKKSDTIGANLAQDFWPQELETYLVPAPR